MNENASTNHDAVLCKLSAEQCGLLPDKFIAEFVHHLHRGRRHIKPPIINRGTFLRSVAIDSIVRNFLSTHPHPHPHVQIISLGAGFDTRLFRFMEEFEGNGQLNSLLLLLKYFEIDFEEVIEEKKRIVEAKSILKEFSAPWRPIPFDLNNFDTVNFDFTQVLGEDFDPSAPTLIIAECCFMYLTAQATDNFLTWATETLKSVTLCSFDPILAEDLDADRFARTMLDNFESRGLDTHGLLAYPSTPSIISRFSRHFPAVQTFSMLQLERDSEAEFLVSGQERRVMAMKTALDEYEEWALLASHYLLIIAKK